MIMLCNSSYIAIATLKHVPQYGSREVCRNVFDTLNMSIIHLSKIVLALVLQILIVYSSLTTCDPGDIFNTIEVTFRILRGKLSNYHIYTSIVHGVKITGSKEV